VQSSEHSGPEQLILQRERSDKKSKKAQKERLTVKQQNSNRLN